MVTRSGHSLAELLVALSFLGATLGAIASGTVVAARTTAGAVHRQHGLSAAAAALDSVLAAPDPASAADRQPGIILVWTVAPERHGRVVRVRALDAGSGAGLADLEGFWIAAPPTLPGGDT
ncbi:MAG TPA: hypothetical protein VMM12_13385 [Longimicrobiales bacterium]|nr:hypothetical protein [Longimicrobiales bacterium]